MYAENGVVLTDTNPRYLYSSPFDWRDLEVKMQRKMETLGLFRVYTLPLSFIKDGATILRYIDGQKGYEAFTQLVIQKRDHTSLSFFDYIVCEVDYSQLSDQPDNHWVKVNLMDKAIADFIKANENITFEIPLDDPDALTINMDGINLKNKTTWIISDGSDPSNNPCPAHIWDTRIAITESVNTMDVQDVPWQKWDTFQTDVIDNDRWLYKASFNGQITFKWDFTVDFNPLIGGNYSAYYPLIQLFKVPLGGTQTSIHELLNLNGVSPGTYLNQIYHVVGSITIAVSVGDTFYFSSRVMNTPPASEFLIFNYGTDSFVELSYMSRLSGRIVKGFRVIDVWKKLLAKASGNKYGVLSTYLSNAAVNYAANLGNSAYNTVLTGGDGIRGIAGAKMKVSINLLRKFCRTAFAIADTIEGNNLRIEPYTYLFDKNNVITRVKAMGNFMRSTAADLLISSLKIGYEAETYEELNGKDAFNTTHEYKLPVTRPKGMLDLISAVKADMYSAEFARFKNEKSDTTDAETDNAVFALEIDATPSSGVYQLKRWGGGMTGLIAPETAYNLGLSPKRCLYRNLQYIYSLLPNQTDGKITYQTSDKNNALRSTLPFPVGVTIDEDADVTIATDILRPTETLFKPKYLEFDCIPPKNLLTLITANPYGVIEVEHNGKTYKGFIVEIGMKPETRDVYKWKLLEAAQYI